jgi:hypothetical protein
VHAGKACSNHDSVKVLNCASHLFLHPFVVWTTD